MLVAAGCDSESGDPAQTGGGGGGGNEGGMASGGASSGGGSAGGAPATGGARTGGMGGDDGGAGGIGGFGGEGPGPDELAIDDFEDGLDAWTASGAAALVARAGGGSAVRFQMTTEACGTASIEQTVTVPAGATTIRVTVWADHEVDGNSKQAWMTLDSWLADFSSVTGAEAGEILYCVPEVLRGEAIQLSLVARTQGDCGSPVALTFYVDDLSWETGDVVCTELLPPT